MGSVWEAEVIGFFEDDVDDAGDDDDVADVADDDDDDDVVDDDDDDG